MTKNQRFFSLQSLLTLLLCQPMWAQSDSSTADLTAKDRQQRASTRLALAEVLLHADEASDRLAGLNEIVHQSARGSFLRPDLEDLLWQATRDPVAAVAALADRALANLDAASQPEPQSDERARELSKQSRLRWAAAEIVRVEPGRRSNDRFAAVQTVADLASRVGSPGSELETLLTYASRDPDPQIRELATRVLSSRDHSQSEHNQGVARRGPDQAANTRLSATHDPDPEVRWSGLQWAAEIAQSEGVDSDPRLLAALSAHRNDPDPRIASFCRFVLAGLGGDRNAVGQVYAQKDASQEDRRR